MSRLAAGRSIRHLVLCGLCIAAPRLGAQQDAGVARSPTVDRTQVLADSLEAQAVRLSAKPGRWLDASRLQRRAARLRGDDPQAVGAWSRAAWFYAGSGKLDLARRMMEEAARHAATVGDVERGASAWLDAALIAAEDGRSDLVPGLLRRMRLVSESPLLPESRREVILARAGGEPRLARYQRP
jgi:hypothetical protein